MFVFKLVCALAAISFSNSVSTDSIVTPGDRERLKALFESVKPFVDDDTEDLQSVHYSLQGLGYLGVTLTKKDAQDACVAAKKHVKDTSVDSLFYAASVSKILKEKSQYECQLTLPKAEQTLTEAISTESTAQSLYYAITAQACLNLKTDSKNAKEALAGALKKDDSPLSLGYVFMASSLLSGDMKEFYDLIEDTMPQADEVEGTSLQFEGGLFPTALVIDGSFRLSTTVKKSPLIKDEEVLKFTNYLLSRKHSHSLRNAAALLSALTTLTTNAYKKPASIFRASPVTIAQGTPKLQVSVTDVFGDSLGKITVTAISAQHVKDNTVILSKKELTSSDGKLFEYDIMAAKPKSGFYTVTLGVTPDSKEKRLVGITDVKLDFKVTTTVSIGEVELKLVDKEQNTPLKAHKVAMPNTLQAVIEADYHQKVTMRFKLTDEIAKAPITAHQAFVKMTHSKTKQEIFFVAEPDSGTLTYSFELDVGAKQKEFGRVAGVYQLELLVGDAMMEKAIQWKVANVDLTFNDNLQYEDDTMDKFQPKPEITHLFRQPDSRPPAVVSTLFTCLALAPLGLLLIIWIKIGVNIDFQISLKSIGFHGGLGAIFALYFAYWWGLNMFATIKYLGVIGVPTFFLGNKLLSSLASARRKKA